MYGYPLGLMLVTFLCAVSLNGLTPFAFFKKYDWYNNSWNYRVAVTIQSAKVSGSHTNFPVYLDLSLLPAGFFSNVKSDGSDIVVTNALNEKLDRELEFIDVASSKGGIWFRMPTLAGNEEIRIYYGNSGGSETNTTAVWNSNFVGVWHADDDPGAGGAVLSDSTGNNNGSFQGSMNTADRVDGKVGKALDFDGSNDYVIVSADGGVLDLHGSGQQLTVCSWVLFRKHNDFGTILSKGDTQYHLKYSWTNAWEFKANSTWIDGDTTYSAANYNIWYHVCGVADGSTIKMYVDTVLQADTASVTTISNESDAVWIGQDSEQPGSRNEFNGKLDEIKVSNTARSANWITTEYNNQSNGATFFSIGTQVSK